MHGVISLSDGTSCDKGMLTSVLLFLKLVFRTETRSPAPVPPPRGRSKQRGSALKSQPVKADHSILPLRYSVISISGL